MHLKQMAMLIILLGLALSAIAFCYMRPKALLNLHTVYRLWKLLLISSITIIVIGILLISLPASIW